MICYASSWSKPAPTICTTLACLFALIIQSNAQTALSMENFKSTSFIYETSCSIHLRSSSLRDNKASEDLWEERQGNQLVTLKQALNFVLSFSFEWLRLSEDGAWHQFGARGDDLNAADLYRWRRLQCSFAVECEALHLTRLLNRE